MMNNIMNNMMINNMFNNNIIGMNNIGMNPLGFNNQQNLMNGMQMGATAINIKNIIQPYENKIKELEEIIKQKDFEITVLKQKLNNYKYNSMNMNFPINMMSSNNNLMNMKNNSMNMMNCSMNMIFQNINRNFEYIGKELKLKVKYNDNNFEIICYEKDKVNVLRKKFNYDIGNNDFVSNYKWLCPELTFEENGIHKDEKIEIKPILKLYFEFSEIKKLITLSSDCPLSTAISYYLIKLGNPFILEKIINKRIPISFLYNSSRLNIEEKTPINKIFNSNPARILVDENNS